MASLSAEKVMAFSACGGRLFHLHMRSMSVLPSGCRSCLCRRRVNHTVGERREPDAAPSPTTSRLPQRHAAHPVLEQELARAGAASSGDLRPWFLNSRETSWGPIPLPSRAHSTSPCPVCVVLPTVSLTLRRRWLVKGEDAEILVSITLALNTAWTNVTGWSPGPQPM